MTLRTQVGIVGAGPAGLLLARLLQLEGIESVVIETQSRKHVEERNRAGVLEHGTAQLLDTIGAGERMRREGLVHRGIELRFGGRGHRIDLYELTGGRAITVYGQHEVLKDLIRARCATGAPLFFDACEVSVHDIDNTTPRIRFQNEGEHFEVACDFIAGCDGSHGVCRPSIPAGELRLYEKVYPLGWLGILAEAPPASHELIYTNHQRGFALLSMRTPHLSRVYLQCRPDEDLANWSDDRVWDELQRRFETHDGFRLHEGPIIQKGVTAMRSSVVEPMQYRRMFLVGDAAHIVPPTGAKGLNLAAADAYVLSRALSSWYQKGDAGVLERYSATCLRRVWRVQHFSWWMTWMLHRANDADGFDYRRQLAELDNIVSSRAAATNLAENYAGLLFDFPGDPL